MANLKKSYLRWFLLPVFFMGEVVSAFWVLRRWKPDVIHAHWIIPQGVAAYLLKKWLGCSAPVLLTAHGSDVHGLRSRPMMAIKRAVLNSVDKITVVGRPMVGELQKEVVERKDVVAEPMGVNMLELFNPDEQLKPVKGRILFVGRLVASKGASLLVAAVAQLHKRIPECHLHIVGNGPEMRTLQEKALSMGVGERVRFFGAVNQLELPEHYRGASVFAAPFLENEGLGLVAVEALACGCPAVLADIPASRDLSEGIRGVLFHSPGDLEALVDVLEKALLSQRYLRREVFDSIPLLRRRFDWESVAERYSVLLSKLASEN